MHDHVTEWEDMTTNIWPARPFDAEFFPRMPLTLICLIILNHTLLLREVCVFILLGCFSR